MKSKAQRMCGGAGSSKSNLAKKFDRNGMILLSYDAESFKRGLKIHSLSQDIQREIKMYLDTMLVSLIRQSKDIVLDYSF